MPDHDKENESDSAKHEFRRKHEEQVAFRGLLGDVCANASSNATHPELCGNEGPIVDDEGHLVVPTSEDVPRSAPKK